MIEPAPIRVAGVIFGFHVPSLQWRNDRTPWRIKHSDTHGWYAVNIETRETLMTATQTLRSLRVFLAPRLKGETR